MDSARLRTYLGTALTLASLAGCRADAPPLVLAATTSTYDSGLLEALVEAYRVERPDVSVRAIWAGSGEALELGRRGDVDVLLVHAPEAEERFIAAGHADGRVPIMYNGFLVVGPPGDPAGVRGLDDPAEALARIALARAPFVSRGDSSGTHAREVALWGTAIERFDRSGWYIESGQGQGSTLQVASEREAYTLTDEATFATLRHLLDLEAMVAGHASLLNLYSAIRPAGALRVDEAERFIEWLSSTPGRRAIAEFEGGSPPRRLFTPFSLGDRLPLPASPELEEEADSVPPS